MENLPVDVALGVGAVYFRPGLGCIVLLVSSLPLSKVLLSLFFQGLEPSGAFIKAPCCDFWCSWGTLNAKPLKVLSYDVSLVLVC